MKIVSNGVNEQGEVYGGYIYSPDGVKIEIIDRSTPTAPAPFRFEHTISDRPPAGTYIELTEGLNRL